jgi:hypothetical protein
VHFEHSNNSGIPHKQKQDIAPSVNTVQGLQVYVQNENK